MCIGACTQLQISWYPKTNMWQQDELSQDAPEHEINQESGSASRAKAALLTGEMTWEKEVEGQLLCATQPEENKKKKETDSRKS